MSEINTGGPAFPDGSTNEWGNATRGGMTLRDYFAAKAMQGVLASPLLTAKTDEELSASCYKMADAMLKAREK
jgi:hypothetical protein